MANDRLLTLVIFNPIIKGNNFRSISNCFLDLAYKVL